MTYHEAEERAGRLWSDVAKVARVRYDPERWEVLIDAVHGRSPRGVHHMDQHGHPTCHRDCIAREAAIGMESA